MKRLEGFSNALSVTVRVFTVRVTVRLTVRFTVRVTVRVFTVWFPGNRFRAYGFHGQARHVDDMNFVFAE